MPNSTCRLNLGSVLLVLTSVALAGMAGVAAPVAAASIVSATPQGEVSQVQQVLLTFSEAVIELGSARPADPATVACTGTGTGNSVTGTGNWVSPRVWSHDFRRALPPGTSCTVSVKPDWVPASGNALTGRTRFSFQTGGPSVQQVFPSAGSAIEEEQHFLVQFNGPPVAASVAAHAWCEVEGLGERVPMQLVEGPAREAVLKSLGRTRSAAQALLMRCQRPLAHDTRVRIVLGPGIAALGSPALVTRSPQRLEYRVRRAFQADFSCERERAQAPCVPVRPFTLSFSEPVARELAAAIRLVPETGGRAQAPDLEAEGQASEVSSLRFKPPFAENARYRIELPAAPKDAPKDAPKNAIKDASGRTLANAASFPLTVSTAAAPPIAKFAAAPFGILEIQAEPVLPMTLRHVQGDLTPNARGGEVKVLRLREPLAMMQAYARVKRLHEQQITAKEAGLPKDQWMETISEPDARGREVKRQVERSIGTREISMLAANSSAKRLDLPALQGQDPRPFEVVGIPLPEPGLHVVEVASRQLGAALLDAQDGSGTGTPRTPRTMYVRTAALVTNLAVHVKLARDGGLIWVTSLDRGRPVAGADVQVLDCRGEARFAGRTDALGRLPLTQPLAPAKGDCLVDEGYFVFAQLAPAADARANAPAESRGDADVAFTFSGWTQGIDAWRFNLPVASPGFGGARRPTWQAHTVFDRTLLRAGDTVSMKHFVRAETSAGLAFIAAEKRPTRLRITHEGSGREQTVPIHWRATRSATSSWAIPATAALGRYQVRLERDAPATHPDPDEPTSWESGSFRVEAFRVPLVDARLVPPAGTLVAPRELPLAVQMNHMAGGAMARAPLRGTAMWRERGLGFAAYPEFSFQAPRDETISEREARGDDTEQETAVPSAGLLLASRVGITTDAQGAARWVVPIASAPTAGAPPALPAPLRRPGEVISELSYQDPNGETQTVTSRVPTWPSSVVVGLRTAGWVSTRGELAFTALALDTAGKPLKGQKIEVRARLSQFLTTRKRLVGGFYAYDHRTQHKDLGVLCSGQSDAFGRLACTGTVQQAGEVELIAQASDANGHRAEAATSLWIVRDGELWFAQDNDDRIDVLAERQRVEPGETAKLQVRMPYREATALVSVEREGVIDTQVVTLRGSDPTVSVKVEPHWGPNVYVSVLVVRGRIREVPWYSFFRWGWREPVSWARAFWYEGRSYQAPTAMVDLAKPSARFGVAALRVGTVANELKVRVSADQAQYMIRGKAQARVQVSLPNGQPAAGAEVAFAAVDEGLLALQTNESWALLNGLVRERPWGVETATGMSEVIGRRHYGRKTVPAGGGGGRAGARELFDTLLVWQPNVTLDAKGEAVVEVPLNDSLTSFRLVAVADLSDDRHQRFGHGHTSIRVTQDLQVLAGLPPVVREGDQFTALVTLRNTTQREMQLTAELSGQPELNATTGAPSTTASTTDSAGARAAPAPINLAPQTLTLPPGSARELAWPVTVPAGVDRITWSASAVERAAPHTQDRMRWVQQVAEAVPLRVLQAAVQPLEAPLSWPMTVPADALSTPAGSPRGGVQISAQSQLTGALPGLRRYFETYPYSCLEQKTSRAIGLSDEAAWKHAMNELPGHLDSDGLAAFFPPRAAEAASGSDRLTAHLISIAHDSGHTVPQPALGHMLQGLSAFVQGRLERRAWSPQSDLAVRKLAALAALARHGPLDVRLLSTVSTEPDALGRLPTAALIDWLTVLQRVETVPERAVKLAAVNQQLRARLQLTSTTLRFTTEESDFWYWLMDSADSNAARLLLAVMDEPSWRDDLPRLVVGHLGRQQRGAWLTTTANAWSVVALARFGKAFESTPVTGRTVAQWNTGTGSGVGSGVGSDLGSSAPASIDWSAATPTPVRLPWPGLAQHTLSIRHEGTGRPWLTVQTLAAIPLKEPLRRGYGITRSLNAVEQSTPGSWRRGDVVRVRLEIDAQADMSWVAVSDPIPAGATILGSGLGRDAGLLTQGERREGRAWPAYVERAPDAYRSYYSHLPAGRHVVEYTVRLNNPGQFHLPPTRVEAMYAPQTMGEIPHAVFAVLP